MSKEQRPLTKAEAADKISKSAFLFANVFNDIQLKRLGTTVGLKDGTKGTIGSVFLEYGKAFVDLDMPNKDYVVLLQKQANIRGSLSVDKKSSVGFYIQSDNLGDIGAVDYVIIRKL